MGDNIDKKLTDLDQSFRKSKSPAIAKGRHLPFYRELCDLCMESPSPDDDGEMICGFIIHIFECGQTRFCKRFREISFGILQLHQINGGATAPFTRALARLTNFKLVKVCKAIFGGLHFGLTFRAHEDESEECSLFRGAVKCVIGSGYKAVFCEIKGDDEVTLLPGDDDYISSDSSCDNKDSSLLICSKKDTSDGCPADSGDGSTGDSDVSQREV